MCGEGQGRRMGGRVEGKNPLGAVWSIKKKNFGEGGGGLETDGEGVERSMGRVVITRTAG